MQVTRQELIRQGITQKIVSIGFSKNKYVSSPPVFRVSCGEAMLYNGFDVLRDCASIIGRSNEFDPEKIKSAEPLFKDLYNIFNRSITLSIGMESGPVLYITANIMDSRDLNRVQKMFPNDYSAEELARIKSKFREFKKRCRKIAKSTSAQECDFYKRGPEKICRIWWD